MPSLSSSVVSGSYPVLIIDGFNLVFANFKTKDFDLSFRGEPVSAIYGFYTMVRKRINKYNPRVVIVVWEGRHNKERRKKVFPGYKEGRSKLTDRERENLFWQVDVIRELNYYSGFSSVAVPSYEADDVMHSLALTSAEELGYRTLLMSGDKDLYQVLRDNILIDRMNHGTMSRGGFERKYGFPPERWVDYKCVVKDTSDNLPGVEGVGKKTVGRILQEMSLNEFLHHGEPNNWREAKLKEPENVEVMEKMRKVVDLSLTDDAELRNAIVSNMSLGKFSKEELEMTLSSYEMVSLKEDLLSYAMRLMALEGNVFHQQLEELYG